MSCDGCFARKDEEIAQAITSDDEAVMEQEDAAPAAATQ